MTGLVRLETQSIDYNLVYAHLVMCNILVIRWCNLCWWLSLWLVGKIIILIKHYHTLFKCWLKPPFLSVGQSFHWRSCVRTGRRCWTVYRTPTQTATISTTTTSAPWSPRPPSNHLQPTPTPSLMRPPAHRPRCPGPCATVAKTSFRDLHLSRSVTV